MYGYATAGHPSNSRLRAITTARLRTPPRRRNPRGGLRAGLLLALACAVLWAGFAGGLTAAAAALAAVAA